MTNPLAEVKALGPSEFLSTTEEDARCADKAVTAINAELRQKNPDLKSNPEVWLKPPMHWYSLRAAVREGVKKRFEDAGWQFSIQDDQRDGMSFILKAKRVG